MGNFISHQASRRTEFLFHFHAHLSFLSDTGEVASYKYRQEVNFDKAPYSRYNERKKVTKDKSMTNSKYHTPETFRGPVAWDSKMIEEDRDCADIVTQLTAVKSSVERVIEMIITENLTDCINQPLDDPEAQRNA